MVEESTQTKEGSPHIASLCSAPSSRRRSTETLGALGKNRGSAEGEQQEANLPAQNSSAPFSYLKKPIPVKKDAGADPQHQS